MPLIQPSALPLPCLIWVVRLVRPACRPPAAGVSSIATLGWDEERLHVTLQIGSSPAIGGITPSYSILATPQAPRSVEAVTSAPLKMRSCALPPLRSHNPALRRPLRFSNEARRPGLGKAGYEGTSRVPRRHQSKARSQYNFLGMPTISEECTATSLTPTVQSSSALQDLFSSSRKRSVVSPCCCCSSRSPSITALFTMHLSTSTTTGMLRRTLHVHAGLTPATLKWALTTFACENWHPLTWVPTLWTGNYSERMLPDTII